jgi:hypothetical protein
MKAFLATVLFMAAPAAFAQTYSAAPPLAQPQAGIFDWRETPRNQQIEVVRAVFDASGYLLYDTNGQIISVPFAGNLYALQFGKTSGAMYFVNEGDSVPTLYLPDGAFLENAAVSGARWYPFPQRYYYSRPVFLGPAPSWDAYCNMGWYPGMAVYGGYWGTSPWRTGIVYSPMSSLTISIGTRICRDWDDFCLFGRGYTSVRPIIIRDTRPIFIDQRERWDRSRGNDKSWDRGRPITQESSRPSFQAPARHSEERAQGRGGSERFNYGAPSAVPSGSVPGSPGSSSREREQRIYSTSPSYSAPQMTPVRPSSSGYTPPSGANGPLPSRERESGRGSSTPGYSAPQMTPVRPGSTNMGSPFGSSREREVGRMSSEPTRTRTYDAPRESRGAPAPSRQSLPSREGSSSRERERGKK